jgi:hypothetical protein
MLSILTEWWFWPIVLILGPAAVGAIGMLLIAILSAPFQAASAGARELLIPAPSDQFVQASEEDLKEALSHQPTERCRRHEALQSCAWYLKWDRAWNYVLVASVAGGPHSLGSVSSTSWVLKAFSPGAIGVAQGRPKFTA